jgi:hypothetical protein
MSFDEGRQDLVILGRTATCQHMTVPLQAKQLFFFGRRAHYLATSWLISDSTGEPDREPMRPQVTTPSYTSAYHAYAAVMAAVMARKLNGKGAFIDVATFDAQVSHILGISAHLICLGRSIRWRRSQLAT